MTSSPFQLLLAGATRPPDADEMMSADQPDGHTQAVFMDDVISGTRLARQAQPFLGEFLARLGRAAIGSCTTQQRTNGVRRHSPALDRGASCVAKATSQFDGGFDLYLAADDGDLGLAPSPHVPFSILLQERPETAGLVAAARRGWASVATFPEGVDGAGVQYFTEWCRELRLSIIWLVADEQELAAVLKSDAPYVGLLVSEAADGSASLRRAVRLRSLVPSDCVAICFFELETPALRDQLAALKCAAYVELRGG